MPGLTHLRQAQGIVRLEQTYGAARLEAAYTRALAFDDATCRTVKKILVAGVDIQSLRKRYPPQGRAPIRTAHRPLSLGGD